MPFWMVVALSLLAVAVYYREQLYSEWKAARSDWKSWAKRMWKEWGEPFLIAAVIALVVRTFALGPYKIPTGSMRPTLVEGDRIFVDKVTYRFRAPRRGEIVVFKFPQNLKVDFVKRIIAFGGEEVEIRRGVAYIDGKPLSQLVSTPPYYYHNKPDWNYGKEGQKIKIPEDSFFVLGDNSAHSSDSRNWGFVPKRNLVGRAFLVWWPLHRLGFLH